jgi:hypothetical protein
MSLFSKPTTLPAPTAAAIDVDTMQQRAPSLVNLYKTAGVSLTKQGIAGQRAAVHLVLDHSGSMAHLYADGTVQRLAEQALALAANLDDDGVVPVTFFHNSAYTPMDAVIGSHDGVVDRMRREAGIGWGGTNYAPAMQCVINEHQKAAPGIPAFVIFQTDGACQDRPATERLLRDSSHLPIFWQFLGFGDPQSHEFAFLRSLDTLRGRAVDNAGFCATGRKPKALADGDLYDRLLNEFPTWLTAARGARLTA